MTAFDDERDRINQRLAELDRMINALECMLAVSRAVFRSLDTYDDNTTQLRNLFLLKDEKAN